MGDPVNDGSLEFYKTNKSKLKKFAITILEQELQRKLKVRLKLKGEYAENDSIERQIQIHEGKQKKIQKKIQEKVTKKIKEEMQKFENVISSEEFIKKYSSKEYKFDIKGEDYTAHVMIKFKELTNNPEKVFLGCMVIPNCNNKYNKNHINATYKNYLYKFNKKYQAADKQNHVLYDNDNKSESVSRKESSILILSIIKSEAKHCALEILEEELRVKLKVKSLDDNLIEEEIQKFKKEINKLANEEFIKKYLLEEGLKYEIKVVEDCTVCVMIKLKKDPIDPRCVYIGCEVASDDNKDGIDKIYQGFSDEFDEDYKDSIEICQIFTIGGEINGIANQV